MEEKIIKFAISVDGERLFSIEAQGTAEVVETFNKQVLIDRFGLFDKVKESFHKVIINQMELKMQMVFRDKKGHFVNPLIEVKPIE